MLDVERGQLDALRPLFWQTDTSISMKSWGYIQNDELRSADSLIDELIDIASKNGTLLLNIGPRPDGTIPEGEEKTLLDMGQWLGTNGEAIYATRPWKIYGDGPALGDQGKGRFNEQGRKQLTAADVRFTTKGKAIYAFVMGWPEKEAVVKPLGTAGKIVNVELLGHKAKVQWKQEADGLKVQMPAEKPSDYAVTLKVTLA